MITNMFIIPILGYLEILDNKSESLINSKSSILFSLVGCIVQDNYLCPGATFNTKSIITHWVYQTIVWTRYIIPIY